MYFRSIWLNDVEIPPLVKGVQDRFTRDYEKRFWAGQTKGLYRPDDWARISFCHERVAEIGGSILDIGVGPGGLLNILQLDERFDRVTGIDIRQYSKLVKLSDDLDIRIMDVSDMSFEDRSFDTLVCMEVLEHIEKPHFLRAVSELRRVAAKRIFMTIPLREPEPLPSYHKLRFDFPDIAKHFPSGDFYILQPRRGVPWLAIIEDLGQPRPAASTDEAQSGKASTNRAAAGETASGRATAALAMSGHAQHIDLAPRHIDAQPREEFELIDAATFAESEADAARDYWANVDIAFYKKPRPWSDFIAERVLQFKPATVFEFGCNAGKNLDRIRSLAADVEVSGLDINPAAVEFAQSQGLNVSVGDDTMLRDADDPSIDVSFTVSVLDHLPNPEEALASLARQSRIAVLLLEPWLGAEGKVVKNTDRRSGELIDTTPYSYSWDYASMVARLLPDWHLKVEKFPLESNLGCFYKLFTVMRSAPPKAIDSPAEGVGSRKVVASTELSTLKQHLPERIYSAIDKMISRKVPSGARRWIKEIEAKRDAMKESDRLLTGIAPKGGYRPGEVVEMRETAPRALRDVVRAAKRPLWCRAIYTMIDKFEPRTALELGTCVGISGAYIAAALKGEGRVYTLEGASDFSMTAEETAKALKIDQRMHFVCGLFDQTLEKTLDAEAEWDFVFIDGHHDGDATLRYLKKIAPRLANHAIVLFDDIRWSSDMLRAWDEVVANDMFPLCIDMDEVGLCAMFPSSQRWLMRLGMDELRT